MKKLITCVIILLAFACKKETGIKGPTGPQGPAGSDGSGTDTLTISGRVSSYDESGAREADQSGVTVTVYNGKDSVTSTSDATGHYHFPGMPRGTYNFTYSRSGYGTMKVFGYSNIPGGNTVPIVPDAAVTQLPDKFAVRSITVTDNLYYSTVIVYLKASSNDFPITNGNLHLLIGRDANVSISHYLYNASLFLQADPVSGGYIGYFDKSNLGGLFAQYDALYYYACTFTRIVQSEPDPRSFIDLGSESYYVSPDTGDFVYPNLSSQILASQF